ADERWGDDGGGAGAPALCGGPPEKRGGRRAGAPPPAGDDRVGTSRDDLERLARDGRIRAGIAFVRDHLDGGPTDVLHQGVIDKIAPGVAESDVSRFLDMILFHALDHRGDHQGRRLWNGNEPLAVWVLRLSGRCE